MRSKGEVSRGRFGAVVVALGLASSAACSEEVIVVATVEGADAGTNREAPTGGRCTKNADCTASQYCERRRCDEPAGSCEPIPILCADKDEDPVCGCDGVTYFNDCLRRAFAVSAGERGECLATAAICGEGKGSCPNGALCANLVAGPSSNQACFGPTLGRCWVVPTDCPSPQRRDRWNACAPSGNVDPDGRCLSTCAAIQGQRPFIRAASCP